MERKWSRERIVHGNGTEWLPLGECSWFFLRFCCEQKVISRAARHAKEQERNGGGKRDSLFTRTMKGVPSRPLYERRRRSDKLFEFISASPVFKVLARIPPSESGWTACSPFAAPPEFLFRPSIIKLRRQCLQHPSVTSSSGILLVPSTRSLLSSPPESLWSIYGLSPSCLNDDRFRRKTLPSRFVPTCYSLQLALSC